MNILYIGIGGFFGAVSRFAVSKATMNFFGNLIPYGTVAVNVLGSFLLGLLFTLSVIKMSDGSTFRAFVCIGFLGSFTTFSTFSVEAVNLLEEKSYLFFCIYIAANVILSLIAAFIGVYFAKLWGT